MKFQAPARGLLVVVLSLAATSRILAVAPEIKDEAKFFSAEAVKKANKAIRDIARKYDRDLLIETVASPPGEEAQRVKALPHDEQSKYMRNWATDRAEAAVVNGVYVFVCKEPARIEIVITSKAKASFDKQVFEKLRDGLLKGFREKKFDEALEKTVSTVRDAFEQSKAN
jgi:hypothetical protein